MLLLDDEDDGVWVLCFVAWPLGVAAAVAEAAAEEEILVGWLGAAGCTDDDFGTPGTAAGPMPFCLSVGTAELLLLLVVVV